MENLFIRLGRFEYQCHRDIVVGEHKSVNGASVDYGTPYVRLGIDGIGIERYDVSLAEVGAVHSLGVIGAKGKGGDLSVLFLYLGDEQGI